MFKDETTAPVIDPGRGKTKKGFFWRDRVRRPGARRHQSAGHLVPICAGTQWQLRRTVPPKLARNIPAMRRL
ncbi:hypothetical protein [Mesorhizobium helmanticense]|uniref:hypothetical protein n=1 Tax=Mesorhizobium helmanticense TaxID=1776423 RepID=UPI0024782D79|nr:hypothetical protein [Mesorhizobium helmanticense]